MKRCRYSYSKRNPYDACGQNHCHIVLTYLTVSLPTVPPYALRTAISFDWLRRTADFSHLDLKVSDLLEKHATPEDRALHIDLANWLLKYLEGNNA